MEPKELIENILSPFTDKEREILASDAQHWAYEYPNIGICELGSCQYKPIEDSARFYSAVIEKLGYARLISALGIRDASTMLLKDFVTTLREDTVIPDIYSLEDYYNYTRNLAWDLWSVTILPIDIFSENLDRSLSPEVHKGPMLNRAAWEDNHKVGLEIAIAMYIYGTELSLYADYDT